MWCTQSVSRHLLFSPGFWQSLVLVQLDLWAAGILPMSVGLRRLADLWVTLALALALARARARARARALTLPPTLALTLGLQPARAAGARPAARRGRGAAAQSSGAPEGTMVACLVGGEGSAASGVRAGKSAGTRPYAQPGKRMEGCDGACPVRCSDSVRLEFNIPISGVYGLSTLFRTLWRQDFELYIGWAWGVGVHRRSASGATRLGTETCTHIYEA